MPNTIDSQGVNIQTVDEILTGLKNGTPEYPGMFGIYGPEINVDPNSPDGQMLNIFAQAKRDILEFTRQIYDSFDPDQATGATLDQRCAINGVARKKGTSTQVDVLITVSAAVALQGQAGETPFVIADAQGNEFVLVDSYTFGGAGSATRRFSATSFGPISAAANTLTRMVTILPGVTSVNNPTGPASIGTDQETDAQLRLRRQHSVSMPATGYIEGLRGALLQVDGVTQANVFENYTSSIDGNGIPGHSIWAIVAGGSNSDVGFAIYRYRSAGCGMKGSNVVPITTIDAQTGSVTGSVDIYFDRPIAQNLWFRMDITPITGTVDTAWLRSQILSWFIYSAGQKADSASFVAYVKELAPNASISNEGVSSDGVSYTSLLAPTTLQYQFTLAAARVVINGSGG